MSETLSALNRFKAALDSTGYAFAHYGWKTNAKVLRGDYGVWNEDGAEDFEANGIHTESGLTGVLDYFTRDDSGTPKTTIEAALNALEACAWRLYTVQFEEDTGYIHYQWSFGLYGAA